MTWTWRGVGSKNRNTTTPATTSTNPSAPSTGPRYRGNDTSRSTARSGRQNAATRRNMRREDRVTVQGPVKKLQPDGMSHRGAGLAASDARANFVEWLLPTPSPPPPPPPLHFVGCCRNMPSQHHGLSAV